MPAAARGTSRSGTVGPGARRGSSHARTRASPGRLPAAHRGSPGPPASSQALDDPAPPAKPARPRRARPRRARWRGSLRPDRWRSPPCHRPATCRAVRVAARKPSRQGSHRRSAGSRASAGASGSHAAKCDWHLPMACRRRRTACGRYLLRGRLRQDRRAQCTARDGAPSRRPRHSRCLVRSAVARRPVDDHHRPAITSSSRPSSTL